MPNAARAPRVVPSSSPFPEVPAWAAGPGWALHAGDCLERLAALPAASVDLVFADPPYFLCNGGFTCQSGRRAPVDKGAWDASRGIEEDHRFTAAWLEACGRVLKPTGTLWVSGTQHVIFSAGFAMQTLGCQLAQHRHLVQAEREPEPLVPLLHPLARRSLIWAAPRAARAAAARLQLPAR